MYQKFKENLSVNVPPEYNDEFFRKNHQDNARNCLIVAQLSLLFVAVLFILDAVRYWEGTLLKHPVYVGLLITHGVLALMIIPYFLVRRLFKRNIPGPPSFGAAPTWITLAILSASLLPMAIFSVLDRGAITVFAIFILIVNLVFNLRHTDRVWINGAAFLIIATSIVVIQRRDVNMLILNLSESLGIIVPCLVFATFQFNLKINEFVNGKLLSAKNHMIEAEKQRSEALLLNILPASIAGELMTSGVVRPQHYPQVTIMFTDFKGFSKICRSLTPEQLIADLSHCFKNFDRICSSHGVERVKTIGDAYMGVAGITGDSSGHASRMVEAALEIQLFLADWKKEKQRLELPVFEARIGIHTGTVIVGVVGTAKFAFDIWGDAVNVAARLEKAGEPARVNISESTYALVKDDFVCTFRGKLPIKHIGEAEMYFVEGNARL